MLLHWFISQALFLARIAFYKGNVPLDQAELKSYMDATSRYGAWNGNVLFSVGYSIDALFASIIWGSALIASCLLVAAICKYPKTIPLGGTNSAVISAACHVRAASGGRGSDKQEEEIVLEPLMWGVTSLGSRDTIGHCSFSAEEVTKPRQGYLYAGREH
jgi:hypothetical protein